MSDNQNPNYPQDPYGAQNSWGQPPAAGQPGAQGQPGADPYGQPAAQPYGQPGAGPYGQPAAQPYGQPSADPYGQPAAQPSADPYAAGQPAGQPYGQPTGDSNGWNTSSSTTTGSTFSSSTSATGGSAQWFNGTQTNFNATKTIKTGGAARAIIGVVVTLVALGVLVIPRVNNFLSSRLDIGSCISVTDKGREVEHEKVDCGSSGITYTVVEKASSCGVPYSTYTFKRSGSSTSYCLMINLVEGKCYSIDNNDAFAEVGCTDARAVVKVTQRIENTTDESACGAEAEQVLTFGKDPKRLYCLAQP